MTKKEATELKAELKGVRDSARMIRDYMLNKDIPLAERKQEIDTMRTANNANKTLVSSVINTIVIDKLSA